MKNRTKRILLNISEGIIAFIISILCFFLLITTTLNIVYSRTYITNVSMQPTLNLGVKSGGQEGDFVYVNRFATYKPGDIVIANVSWWGSPIIKRLVGCPGDKVQIKDEDGVYKLYCNDKLLYTKEKTSEALLDGYNRGSSVYYYETVYDDFINNTKYIANPSQATDFSSNIGELNGEKCIVLNKDEYLLMGDNWGKTDDCLKFGPVSYKNLAGKVDYVIPLGENHFKYLMNFINQILFTKENTFVY